MGCRSENWCRYRVVKCCEEIGIKNCSECSNYPCDSMKECFAVTKSFEPKCREVCTDEEYEKLKKRFFEKEGNLQAERKNLILQIKFKSRDKGIHGKRGSPSKKIYCS